MHVLTGAGRGRQRMKFALSHDPEYQCAALHSFGEGKMGERSQVFRNIQENLLLLFILKRITDKEIDQKT